MSEYNVFELAKEYDVVADFLEDSDTIQIRFPLTSDWGKYVLAQKLGEKTLVVAEDGGGQIVPDKTGSCCENDEEYTPSRSASLEQSYDNRRGAACKHRKAVLDSVIVDSRECDCIISQVQKIGLKSGGRTVINQYQCPECHSEIIVK